MMDLPELLVLDVSHGSCALYMKMARQENVKEVYGLLIVHLA